MPSGDIVAQHITAGNNSHPAILSALAEVAVSLERQGVHDEARALHDLIPEVRRAEERARLAEENNRRWREQWEHTRALFELPGSEVSPADKLILWRLRGEAVRRREEGIAGPQPVLIGDIATDSGAARGLASGVGMSPGQVGEPPQGGRGGVRRDKAHPGQGPGDRQDARAHRVHGRVLGKPRHCPPYTGVQ